MGAIWNRVQELKGKTLLTLARGSKFVVQDVLSDRIQFIPVNGNGTLRWAGRDQIEHIAGLNLDESDLRPVRLVLEYPNDQNLSYIAAIVYEVSKSTS